MLNKCIDCGTFINVYAKRCKPCAGKITSKRLKGTKVSLLQKEKIRKIMLKLHKNPEFRKVYLASRKKGKAHPNYKHGRSSKSNYCVDCSKQIHWRSTRCKSCSNRINSKKYWLDENYREKMLKIMLRCSKVKPNKKEKLLDKLLNKSLFNEYKFVGNGKFWIDRFNPDFINCNGQKKIIELYGCYWHNCPKCGRGKKKPIDVGRLKTYKKYGYKTLIVWEHELKDLEKVKIRVLKFNKK